MICPQRQWDSQQLIWRLVNIFGVSPHDQFLVFIFQPIMIEHDAITFDAITFNNPTVFQNPVTYYTYIVTKQYTHTSFFSTRVCYIGVMCPSGKEEWQ